MTPTNHSTEESLLDADGRLLVPLQEAGKMLNLGRNATYQAASRGEILTVKIGKKKSVPWWWLIQKVTGEAA